MNIIIMAGGAGTRFWPASRAQKPKQFLRIIGSQTLIEQTFRRVSPLTDEENITVVINELHRDLMKEVFRGREVHILVEPVGRNTAPCIGLAAVHLRRQAGDVPMVVLPADHFIADEEGFRSALRAGAKLAESGGIVTIGIAPTRPETGYGYILKGAQRSKSLSHPVYLVEQFVEKPDLPTAAEYLSSGRHVWNSGIFIFTPNAILAEIEQHLPQLYRGLMLLQKELGRAGYPARLTRIYQQAPNISIDYGVMEKTTRAVYVLPGSFGWSDVGSWQALYELRRADWDDHENLSDGQPLLIDTNGSFVHSTTDRLVATLGLRDILIVDTPTGLLVADRHRSQEVRRIIRELKEKNWKQFL